MKHNNSWKRYLCLVFCLFLMCITFGCGPEKKEKSHTETSEIVTEINNDEDEEIEKSINNNNDGSIMGALLKKANATMIEKITIDKQADADDIIAAMKEKAGI